MGKRGTKLIVAGITAVFIVIAAFAVLKEEPVIQADTNEFFGGWEIAYYDFGEGIASAEAMKALGVNMKIYFYDDFSGQVFKEDNGTPVNFEWEYSGGKGGFVWAQDISGKAKFAYSAKQDILIWGENGDSVMVFERIN